MKRDEAIEEAASALFEAGVSCGHCDSVALDECPMCRQELHDYAGQVLDAILPHISTLAELEALPVGTILLSSGGRIWIRNQRYWWCPTPNMAATFPYAGGPLTVVWRP